MFPFYCLYLTFVLIFKPLNSADVNLKSEKKMQVEIWSDIVCPFCYIGKRKFEKALREFKHKDHVVVHWRSYQLDPIAESQGHENAYAYLARVKGQSLEWSVKMHQNVTEMAAAVGLDYHFEKAIVSNSHQAHRLIQLARLKGIDADVEELLFKAYFVEGKNIGDAETLVELAAKVGLNTNEAREAVNTEKFSTAIKADIEAGEGFGLSGVPFFVFDRKFSVAGAQDSQVFLSALERSFEEFSSLNFQNAKK